MAPERWDAEKRLSAAQVLPLLKKQFPKIEPRKAVPFSEGWDTFLFLVNGTYVFRFPKRKKVERMLGKEILLLKELAGELPSPVPKFEFIGRPGGDVPYRFVGYRKLPGTAGVELGRLPPLSGEFAEALGRFFSALHSFPAARASKLEVPLEMEDGALPAMQKYWIERSKILSSLFTKESFAALQDYLHRDAGSLGKHAGPPRLIHNDISSEHILLAEDLRTVTGVIDWGSVEYGDPAMDFGGLLGWLGAGFMTKVLEHYALPIDDALPERARFIAICEGLSDVDYGVKTKRAQFARMGALAVKNCLS